MLTRDVQHQADAAAAVCNSKQHALADTDSSSHCGDAQQAHVLKLQLFSQHPTVDFGSVSVGSFATHYLRAENPTLLTQHLSIDKVPVQDGFSLSADPSLPAAASLSWSSAVAPHSDVLLPITWKPTAAGSVSRLIVFKLDDKHRLQVKLLGKAVVNYHQPTSRHADQSARIAGQRSSKAEAAVKRPALSSSSSSSGGIAAPEARPKQPLAPAPTNQAAAGSRASRPAAAGGASGGSGTGSSTARGVTTAQPPARFKAPTRSSAGAGSLKLKPQAGAAARAGGLSSKAAATGGATAQQSPWQEAAAASSGFAGGMVVPSTPRGMRIAAPSPASTPAGAAAGGNKGASSRGLGGVSSSLSLSSSSSQKAPSSARKTFRFFHTELWMNKQDRAFTGWLNHLLMPYTPEYLRAASEGDTSAALSDLRLAARVQGAMVACYRTDAELRETMIKVEESIDAGKLRMKPEVVLMGDVVQRRQALEVLMSYNPFWLRLAAEVVTQRPVQMQGEEVVAPSPGGGQGVHVVARQQTFFEAMRGFLLQHFLADADMAAEMQAGRGAAHYDMEHYTRELGQLVLKRFLLLVLLLDKAATHLTAAFRTPLLFKLTASIKSSRQVVSDFLQSRLVGEGNVLRHLELLGYRLGYSQSALMEYPFAITNLAVDLRDGLRLIKVAEVLTGDASLLQQARFPCDRRPMQLHNTTLALSALQAAGVQLQALPTTTGLVALKPEDLLDGDRERTLSLLWAIARTLQLGTVLKVSALKAEVLRILARTRISGRRPLLPLTVSSGGRSAQQVPLAVYMHDELLSALQEWVQAVCAAYDVSVQNFTTCFGDGVVLCLLVHYYLPNAVDVQDIFISKQRQQEADKAAQAGSQQQQMEQPQQQQQHTDHHQQQRRSLDSEASLPGVASSVCTSAAGVRDMLLTSNAAAAAAANAAAVAEAAAADGTSSAVQWAKGGWAMEFDLAGCGAGGADTEDEALVTSRGVAANFRAVHRAAKALGGVPEMLSAKDFAEHGPDERAVILYAAFLCSRLLECSKDDRAAHIIQTAWRQGKAKTAGMARAHLAKWMAAATVVQRAVRSWLFRRRLQQWLAQHRGAAVALQSAWRGRQVRQQQAQLAASCVLIQREWRQALVRRHAAATAIQAAWRGHLVRKHNGWMCRLLERCLRAYEALRDDRLQRRLAAAVVQSSWRMQMARRQLLAAKAAAVRVQAAWRGYQARQRYKAQQQAVVSLQAAWRGKQARTALASVRAAALVLQAAYRGWQIRRELAVGHAFAVHLQSIYRMGRQRAAFLRARGAATVLQAAVKGHQQRQRFKEVQEAAGVLQSMWRGKLARQQLQQQADAAVVLQAAWRGKAVRAQHQQQHAAATQLQAAWRGFAVVQSYKQQRAAAVALQSMWRGRQVRAEVAQQAAAATVIAAAWRRRTAMRGYAHVQQQVVLLQSFVRMWRAKRALKQHRAAAVVLQSVWRGRVAVQQLQRQRAAAVVLQSSWRGCVQRQQLARMLAAAVVVQAAARGQQARQRYSQMRAAAVVLQSCWRGLQARRLLAAHQAAVVVQTHWRRHKAMRASAAAKAAAVGIQSAWRGYAARRALLEAQAAAVVLQAAVRGWLARQQLQDVQAAAVALQSSWRAVGGRRLLQQHQAAQQIQAAVRGWRVRRDLAQQAAAATAIRAAWLAHKQRQQFLQARAAVIAIQAAARMLAAQRRYAAARAAAVTLQAAWRGMQVRQALAEQQAAAVAIQANFRGWQQRTHYQQQRAAAITIQAAARMARAQAVFATAKAAAITVQAAYRGFAARQQYARAQQAAVVIQTAWRCHSQRSTYLADRASIVRVQACWRGHVAAAAYQQQQGAAVVLQALLRGVQARRQLRQLQVEAAAATVLQTAWRGRAARKAHRRQRRAALVLQSMMRGKLARRTAQEMRDYVNTAKELQKMLLMLHTRSRAATSIQSAWRGWAQRRRWRPVWEAHVEQKQRLQAALTLQRAWRCSQARTELQQMKAAVPRKRARKAWLALLAAVQRAAVQQRLQVAQQEEAVLVIQAAYRGWCVRRVTAKQLAGVRRFQALWRGYKVRQRCGRAGRDARRRLAAVAAAAEAAPQRRIGVRTREALDVLLASRQCSQVITAVAAIEFSTRYSKACCKLMVDSQGVSALLAFMRSCNRSKPHVEMLGHALACLANICRWPDLQEGVLTAPDCVMVLSERLQMFRDTEDIFMATVAILSVLVKSDDGALHVARSAPGAMKLWEGICQLLGRKMDMERKYIERLEGQKGSDVTAREATRKMVAAATQLDALQQIVTRIGAIAAEHNVPLVHMARPGSAGTAAGGAAGVHHHHHHGQHTHGHLSTLQEDHQHHVRDELVPRSAAAVVQPNLWQPKNTIVRGAYREISSQVVAQRAAGPLAAAAAVAPVAPPPVVQSMAAAAEAEAAAALASAGGERGAAVGSAVAAVAAAAAAAGALSSSSSQSRIPMRPFSASAAGAPPAAAVTASGAGSATGPPLKTPRPYSCGGAPAAAGPTQRISSGGSHHKTYGSSSAGGMYPGFGSPAHRPTSSSGGGMGVGGGGGRHSQPETPVNNPLLVLQEGAAPEDTLMAAVQQLAEAQTPTPRRPHSSNRRSSTGGC